VRRGSDPGSPELLCFERGAGGADTDRQRLDPD